MTHCVRCTAHCVGGGIFLPMPTSGPSAFSSRASMAHQDFLTTQRYHGDMMSTVIDYKRVTFLWGTHTHSLLRTCLLDGI